MNLSVPTYHSTNRIGTFGSHTSLTVLTPHPLWHMIIVHELVFGRTANLPIQFKSVDSLDPLYNLDDYVKESKFRLDC